MESDGKVLPSTHTKLETSVGNSNRIVSILILIHFSLLEIMSPFSFGGKDLSQREKKLLCDAWASRGPPWRGRAEDVAESRPFPPHHTLHTTPCLPDTLSSSPTLRLPLQVQHYGKRPQYRSVPFTAPIIAPPILHHFTLTL